MSEVAPDERRNFYGRIRGKTLRTSQKGYLADDLGPLSLPHVTREDNPGRVPLDLAFTSGRPLWLEVGFGGGEHLVAMAAAYPDLFLLGCEGLRRIWVFKTEVFEILAENPHGGLRTSLGRRAGDLDKCCRSWRDRDILARCPGFAAIRPFVSLLLGCGL